MKKTADMTFISRRGLLLVMSSPSGAGKTTLSRRLLASDANITMSVSVTTRAPRPGEVDGRDYHFITHAEFAQLRDREELLEYAEVFGNFYGTPKRPVIEALQAGRDVLFDIDWQGTQQLGATMGEDLVRIFILPPTADELLQRLMGRAQDSTSTVAKRMAKAAAEISHWPEYDYVIVNESLDVASAEIEAILRAERLRRSRRVGLTQFVRELTKDL
ncbi:guanylate kinase [Aestuariivirga sp.]|uniref:guanylate kinase n=1 Tax=Aestuariivirga sp. TaxID=2650926 RepID=UPI003BA8AC79